MVSNQFKTLIRNIESRLYNDYFRKDLFEDDDYIDNNLNRSQGIYPLNLNFISKLTSTYHAEVEKGIKKIANTVKAKYFTTKKEQKDKAKFYLAYQKELVKELTSQFPEIANMLTVQNPSEASFSISPQRSPKIPAILGLLSRNTRENLTKRNVPVSRIQKGLEVEVGYITASIASSHLNSVAFKDAYEVGHFEWQDNLAREDKAKAKQASITSGSIKQFNDALLNNSNNNPGKWVITSGMFSGKTLEEVHSISTGGLASELILNKNPIYAVIKEAKAKDEEIEKFKQLLLVKINKYVGWEGSQHKLPFFNEYEDVLPYIKYFSRDLKRKINSLKKAEADIHIKYGRLAAGFKLDYDKKKQILDATQEKASRWLLNTYATIQANPEAFKQTFGRALPSNKTGLSNSFVAMFKAYDKQTGMIQDILKYKGILEEHDKRTDAFFFETTQRIITRGGVKKSRTVIKFKDPRKNNDDGFAPSDSDVTTDSNLLTNSNDPKDKVGMDARKRIYNKKRNIDPDVVKAQQNKEADYGIHGSNSMLRNMVRGMDPRDQVRFNRLSKALSELPKRTTKEWIVDPFTGESKLMRKGSRLGLMLTYDKHGKLVWREFDVFGKARKSLGGSLERLKNKAIDEQAIHMWVASSMMSDSLLRNRQSSGGGITDLSAAADENNRVRASSPVKGLKSLDSQEQKAQQNNFGASPYTDSNNIVEEVEEARGMYSDKIFKAATHQQLDRTSSRIYEDIAKRSGVVAGPKDHRKDQIFVEQVQNFNSAYGLQPEGYSGPMVTTEQIKVMMQFGTPASRKAIDDFGDSQAKYYAGPKSNSGRQAELRNIDYMLPIQTQISIRRMQLNNSGITF